MNSENKRSVIVGLFVFIGLALFVAGILVLGGQHNSFSRNVTISAHFNTIGGLKKGSNVWFSGVKVGTVRKVNFISDGRVEIQMSIEEKSKDYIRKDAVAALSSEGFIGNKLIEILGGSSDVPAIEDGDILVSKEAMDTDKIISNLQLNNQNLVVITENIKELTNRVNAGEGVIGALFADSGMADNLKLLFADLRKTVANAHQITREFQAFSKQLNNEEGLVGQLINDTTVFKSLQASVAQFEGITQAANALTINLAKTTEHLNQDDNAIGVLLSDEEVAEQLKRTLGNLEASTEKLDKNMEALRHNFLFRGFFKKEAKREAKEAKAQAKALEKEN